jgi:DNA-binding NtrC family response regulator
VPTIDEQLKEVTRRMIVSNLRLDEGVGAFQKRWITIVLAIHRGNQLKAARELHMHRNTLRRYIQCLGIDLQAAKEMRL